MPPTPEEIGRATRLIYPGDAADWTEFVADCHNCLLPAAARATAKGSVICPGCDPRELISDFVQRIFQEPEQKLGAVARGERPLWPYVHRSFGNFLHDRRRRAAVARRVGAQLAVEPAARPPADAGVAWEEVVRLVGHRGAAIRVAMGLGNAAPSQTAALLLSELLVLARQAAESGLHDPPGLHGLVAPLLPPCDPEWQTPFTPADPARTLAAVWGALLPRLADPPHEVTGEVVADAAGCARATWDKWVSRARRRVVDHVGARRAGELFRHWPRRLTGADS